MSWDVKIDPGEYEPPDCGASGARTDATVPTRSGAVLPQILLYLKSRATSNPALPQIPLYLNYRSISNTALPQIPLYLKYRSTSNPTLPHTPLNLTPRSTLHPALCLVHPPAVPPAPLVLRLDCRVDFLVPTGGRHDRQDTVLLQAAFLRQGDRDDIPYKWAAAAGRLGPPLC